MVGENGVPETPDWLPVSRCQDGCAESAVPLSITLRPTLSEATALWDQDWSHWAGDDG